MKKFTVLTAELQHETNTFCALPTTLATFEARGLLRGDDAIAARRSNNTELAGFIDAADAHGWQLRHVLSAHAQPGGRVTREAFEQLTDPIVAAARMLGDQLDGILLGLHGAMATDFCDDGEGELLQRLRRQVGLDIPIAITLDPHVNVSRVMCDLANIMVSFKTYPHIDMRVAGRHAADLLHRAMTGEIRPVTLRVSRPMLEEINGGRTDIGPMIDRIARARTYEQQPDVFAVSVNAGFANADIADVGPSVLVTAQGDLAQHARFASELADDIWNRRRERLSEFYTVGQAAALCKAWGATHAAGTPPIVVADYADNPGGGAYGDSTALLAALLDADVQDACFGPMVDAAAVLQLHRHQLGDTVQLLLGGKTDPRFGGGPLALTATLTSISDGHYVGSGSMIGGLHRSWGPTAVIQVQGIEILVVTERSQMLDLQQFRAFGIDPAARKIVALKSMQHFRDAFEPIAGQVIVCDSGALCTLNYALLPYAHVPRLLFQFDPEMELEPWMQSHAQGIYIPAHPLISPSADAAR
jgi:microcystin degradation protein MlrC